MTSLPRSSLLFTMLTCWLVATGCASTPGDSCQIDDDCRGTQRCIARQCRRAGTATSDAGSGASTAVDAAVTPLIDASPIAPPDAGLAAPLDTGTSLPTGHDAGSPRDAGGPRDASSPPDAYRLPDAYAPPDAFDPCGRDRLRGDLSPAGATAYAYCLVLRRPAEATAITYWVGRYRDGTITSDVLAYELFFTPERGVASMSDATFVDALFEYLLWREGPHGSGPAIDLLRAGSITREELARSVIASPEFCSTHPPLRYVGCP